MPFNQSVSDVSLPCLLLSGLLAIVSLGTVMELIVVKFPVLGGSRHGTVSGPSSLRAWFASLRHSANDALLNSCCSSCRRGWGFSELSLVVPTILVGLVCLPAQKPFHLFSHRRRVIWGPGDQFHNQHLHLLMREWGSDNNRSFSACMSRSICSVS